MQTAMQFDTFIWPHNPKTYRLRYARDLVVHRLPFAAYTVEDLGTSARVLEGVGEFFGPNAYRTFQELADRFAAAQPGVLLHPLLQCSRAYFALLEAAEEPRKDYVRYAFRFVEAPPETDAAQAVSIQSVVPSAGESPWQLALRCGVTTQEILSRNPQLATCHDLQVGRAVRVR